MADNISFLRDKSVVVTSHSWIYREELSRFLSVRARRVMVIKHPFSVSRILKDDLSSTGDLYENGELIKHLRFPAPKRFEPLFWIKDILATFFFMSHVRGKTDMYFGIDILSCFVGLILRALGRVDKVIFYSLDFRSDRFSNRLLNRFYLWIDRMCCYHADCLWFITQAMTEGRIAFGFHPEKFAPIVMIPWGNDFDDIERLPIERINRHQLAYIGVFHDTKGIKLIIDALPLIVSRVPDTRLIVIGTDTNETEIKDLVAQRGLGDRVDFMGFIEDSAEVAYLLARSAVGLAPYLPEPGSFSYYGDAGKIKEYMACGLPVVVTDVPRIARVVAEKKAGILVPYDREALAEASIALLTEDNLYSEYRQNAIELAAESSWPKLIRNALTATNRIKP